MIQNTICSIAIGMWEKYGECEEFISELRKLGKKYRCNDDIFINYVEREVPNESHRDRNYPQSYPTKYFEEMRSYYVEDGEEKYKTIVIEKD